LDAVSSARLSALPLDFPGPALSWTSPAAVYLHSRHASLVGNTFLHLGSDALAGMMGNSLVANNKFTDVGAGAIKIGDSPPTSDQEAVLAPFMSNDTVTGNQISHTGIVDRDSIALWVAQGENNTISQNTLANAPYIGIASAADSGSGWPSTVGNNRISLNLVDHVMQLLNDGSATIPARFTMHGAV
jgi:Protein of unknown function (DUF1565)